VAAVQRRSLTPSTNLQIYSKQYTFLISFHLSSDCTAPWLYYAAYFSSLCIQYILFNYSEQKSPSSCKYMALKLCVLGGSYGRFRLSFNTIYDYWDLPDNGRGWVQQ
jgi:hypothetical protein